MPSGQQTSTATQTTTPDPQLTSANHFGFDQAKALYNSNSPAYYPGTTVANQSTTTQAGYQAAIARGLNGSPVNSAAGSYLQSVLGGQFMPGVGGSSPNAMNAQAGGQQQQGTHWNNPNDTGGQQTAGFTGGGIQPYGGQPQRTGFAPGQGPMEETNSPDPAANARAAAINAQRQQASQGGGGGGQSGFNAASGGLLGVGGNPYTDALNQSISNAVLPAVASQFSSAGRYGSPSMGSEMTRQLADAIAPQVYGNYQNERGLQQQAAGLAPTIANQDWTDINQLQQAGAGQDQHAQDLINGNVNQWNYNQNLDFNKLAQYMGLINGANVGSSGNTTQTTPGTSTTSSILALLGGIAGGAL